MFSSTRVKLAARLRSLRPAGRTMSTQTPGPKTDVLGIVFFSGICVFSAGLGVWQVQRYKWKVDLIERIKNSVNEPPAVIGDCVSQKQFFDKTEPYRGQRVLLTGKFDHSREVFLGLRTAPPSLTGGPAKGMASNPQGYYVVTPFIREDGCTVYINRGWVPRSLYSKQQWQLSHESEEARDQSAPPTKDAPQKQADSWARPEGTVSVVAVMGEGEKAGTFSPVNAVNSNILLWLEPAALLRAATAPSFDKENKEADNFQQAVDGRGSQADGARVQQPETVETMVFADALGPDETGAEGEPEFPFVKPLAQLQEQIVAPETHFVYALTWFSLAGAGLVMTFIKFRRGRGGAVRRK